MSHFSFEKLKLLLDTRSEDLVTVEVIDVKAANRTLIGKYIDNTPKGSVKDLSTLTSMSRMDLRKIKHAATVMTSDENGMYVELTEFGISGHISSSKLPGRPPVAYVSKLYPHGKTLEVCIEYLDMVKKQIVLSLPHEQMIPKEGDIESYAKEDPYRWIEAMVVNTTSFGIIVRPADHDTPGMVHIDEIPEQLITALKSRTEELERANKPHTGDATPELLRQIRGPVLTNLSCLFHKGDVVTVRVLSLDREVNAVQFTMLPSEADMDIYIHASSLDPVEDEDDDEDDVGVDWDNLEEDDEEEREAAAQEAQEQARLDSLGEAIDPQYAGERENFVDDVALPYEYEQVLKWWRGKPYQTTRELEDIRQAELSAQGDGIEEAFESIMAENPKMQQGEWRRLYMLDMMKDMEDYDGGELQAEMDEIDEEIGDMEGFHIDFNEPNFFKTERDDVFPVGAQIDRNIFPKHILDELTFYKDLDARTAEMKEYYKGGSKKAFEPFMMKLFDELDAEDIAAGRSIGDGEGGGLSGRDGGGGGRGRGERGGGDRPERSDAAPRRVWSRRGGRGGGDDDE